MVGLLPFNVEPTGVHRLHGARPCAAPGSPSTVRRELFTHDLAHELLSYGSLREPQVGL